MSAESHLVCDPLTAARKKEGEAVWQRPQASLRARLTLPPPPRPDVGTDHRPFPDGETEAQR